MAVSVSPVVRQPPSDAERGRIRELSRYYCILNRLSAEDGQPAEAFRGDEQPTASYLSADITLTALAQLGVHRLACSRSFVSLIDGNTQHIIAEATASVSLRNKNKHRSHDGTYLGMRSLDSAWGVSPQPIRLFTEHDTGHMIDTANITANRTRYIVRDFTLNDCFEGRPYVLGGPHMRFYADVPLYSPSGYVIGSYCVVDGNARATFGDDEVAILQEIADAIAQHLENVQMVHCHRQAEKLVKGLTNFVKDHENFDPIEVSSYAKLEAITSVPQSGSHKPLSTRELLTPLVEGEDGRDDGELEQTFPMSVTGETSPLLSRIPLSASTEASSLFSAMSEQTVAVSSGEEWPPDDTLKQGTILAPNPSRKDSFQWSESVPISERIAMIFSRASVLLRDSMDLDGVVFLDACRSNVAFASPDSFSDWESMPTANSEFPITQRLSPLVLPSVASSKQSRRPCDSLGFALEAAQNERSASNCPVSVTEELLQTLITAFPQGQVFNMDRAEACNHYAPRGAGTRNSSENESRSLEELTNELSSHIPEAESALFLPLWDWDQSRWLAGTLVWTRDSHRVLGMEELHYFKVFGDSIISEVSRIHWTATEKSKFDFISSISHELRSPLHGILASAELLHITALQPAQREMVKMIETSGLTLLDTTGHLLDFCKINSLKKAKKLGKTQLQDEAASLVSEFDLDDLIEDVANILYTGQQAPETVACLAGRASPSAFLMDLDKQRVTDGAEMSVVLRVEQPRSWKIRSVAGAWRRIVMNLLGNAMKWTDNGFVEISLSNAKSQSDPQSDAAHLTITDTGNGIASDFLNHKLFSPFSQEDPLSEGVGLGLSIVHQLAASLGGHVTVQSDLGIGTQVDVYVPVQHLGHVESVGSAATKEPQPLSSPIQACLIGFNDYPGLKETPTGNLTADAKRKLSIQSTLAGVLVAQLGWDLSLAESVEQASGCIAIIEQTKLRQAMTDGFFSSRIAPTHGFKFVIVLGGNIASPSDHFAPNIIHVSQPFGPRKIYDAAKRILNVNDGLHLLPTPDGTFSEFRQQPEVGPVLQSNSNPLEPLASTSAVGTTCPSSPPSALVAQSPIEQAEVHVLIVDDNEINLKIMATFMHKVGCSYDTARNGLIALEKYKNSTRPYNFVLMDISMPVMDGLISSSRIRQYEKDHGLEPACILAVTGVASLTMQQQALAAGINNYLVKPLSLHDLKRAMHLA